MITDFSTLEKIESYVNGYMVSPELDAFEMEIFLSYDLQAEVNFQKLIKQIVISAKKEEKKYVTQTNSFFLMWTKIMYPINYN